MDELAEAAGVDPLEFRLRHLTDPRAKEVLETAAAHAGWTGRSSELGEGRGLGFARYKNAAAYAAVVAELLVDLDDASVRVRRVVVAADAGETVDPSGLTNQLEGGVVQSISWTLKEEVSFDATRVTSIDWDSYPCGVRKVGSCCGVVLVDESAEQVATLDACRGRWHRVHVRFGRCRWPQV